MTWWQQMKHVIKRKTWEVSEWFSISAFSYPVAAASLSPSDPPGPCCSAPWRCWCQHLKKLKGLLCIFFPLLAHSASFPEGLPGVAEPPGEPPPPARVRNRRWCITTLHTGQKNNVFQLDALFKKRWKELNFPYAQKQLNARPNVNESEVEQ